MHRDAHNLELTCASDAAARAYDHVVEGYLLNRNDTSQRLKALLAEDPACPLAHVMRGAFTMGAFNAGNMDFIRKCLADAKNHGANANARERAHITALELWIDGNFDATMAAWENICAQWPHDILAFRLHHFLGFWLGRPAALMTNVENTLKHWGRDLPAFGTIHACRAFAHEESGSYVIAEHSGHLAVDLNPADIWATHAIAHTYEMQGRRSEGLQLLRTLQHNWDGANNLLHHLWWHQALFHYDRREFDAVLDLYDHNFRNLDSPLTQQMPDLYIDVQNSVSMLYRLERAGLDGGDRWTELADKAQARGGDGSSPFTLPHWMLALVRTERFEAADKLIEGAKAFAAQSHPSQAASLQQAAIPICEAISLDARGDTKKALDTMRPALAAMHTLGGSHAQQDLLERVFADMSMHAKSEDDHRLIIQRVRAKRPAPLDERTAWAGIMN